MKGKIIAIIPARSGSKGISMKNIAKLAGKPLIYYSIKECLKSKFIDRVIVSTDSKKIAEIARKYGAEVPFIRPDDIAKDDTPDLPVFIHALKFLEEKEGYKPEYVVNLRPTCPLRSVEDIDNAVSKILNEKCDSVRTIIKVHQHPYWMVEKEEDKLFAFIKNIDRDKYYQRQLLPDLFITNGGVDVMKSSNILEKNSLYGKDIRGVIMPSNRSVDIDTTLDLKLAELLLKKSEGESEY